jgi:arylsulfatase A
MKRTIVSPTATLLVALFFLLQKPASAQPTKPNVIMILVDDLGWHEFGCFGNAFNESPQVDSMARHGIRFTNAYSAAPVCSPSRGAIMTGEVPVETGITDFMDDNFVEFLDPARFVSLARTLKNNGYHTGIIGKWHLDGHQDGAGLVNTGNGRPALNGFDEVICNETKRIGSGDYWYPYAHLPGLAQKIFPTENLVYRMNLEATQFITRNKSTPFFLYVSHFAVHTTLDAPDSLVAHFNAKRATPGTNVSPTQNPFLAAMIKQVDEGVGQILSALKDNGLDSNSIVIITGDNGGERTVTDNGVLRGGKSYLYEGGVRVPFIARWPGKFASGAVCSTPINLLDFYPTIVALTGATLPANQPMDGLDISRLLMQTGTVPNRDFLWHYPRAVPHFLGGASAGAILHGNYKMIRFYDNDSLHLFNLSTDISEAKDLAADSLSLVRSLASALHAKVTGYLHNFTFQDNFSDKDPADWQTTFGGTWSATAQNYTVTAGAGPKAITDHKYFTNLMYQAHVIVPGGAGNAGLVVRANNCKNGVDAYRGYYAGINANTKVVTFGRAVDGVWALLGQKAKQIDTNTAYLVRVVANGPQFKVFVDDTVSPLLTVSDSTFDGGLIGLRANNIPATFDDVFAIGLSPDSGTVAVSETPAALTGEKEVRLPSRTFMVSHGNRSVRIHFFAANKLRMIMFSLFGITGKTVHNAFAAAEVSQNSCVLRLASGVASGFYGVRIWHDGQSETVRLLVF